LKLGQYPKNIIDETFDDLEKFEELLRSHNIKTYRSKPINKNKISNSFWKTEQYFSYCPRDTALVIENTIIESPNVLRSRYFENFSLFEIFEEKFQEGFNWISAPKQKLLDKNYQLNDLKIPTLTNEEILFDAANIFKVDNNIFYLVSNTGNLKGAEWLKRNIPKNYKLHILENFYSYMHVDTTFVPLNDNTILLNSSRVNKHNLPEFFKNWNCIYFDEPIPTQIHQDFGNSSIWMAMNILSIDERTIIVEETQKPLMKLLKNHNFDCIPIKLTHCRTLGGGPHCITLDLKRK
jgi:glycine amidinotransferase